MSVERAPENDSQDESTFSAASMFGMLLTLGTCLLLQPRGNLSFEKPPEVLNRVCFFFFRLNPIVCAMEAASVLPALMLIFWRAIGSCHGNMFWESGVFAANLQAGAAGLLFLRSHTAHARLDERLIEPAPERGHTVMVMDVITMISVVCTTIKLGASVIPWNFQLITWTYIVDWFLVQLAVMMSHCDSTKEQLDPKVLLQSAEYLQQKARVLEFGQILGGLAFIQLVAIGGSHVPLPLTYPAMMLVTTSNFSILFNGTRRMDVFLLKHMGGSVKRVVPSFIFTGTISIWVLGLVWYEEVGTFKPGWLDWLG